MVGQTLLRGRDSESAALDGLLDAVRGGESRTLVLRGEPGVGKTALLDYTVSAATDLRVLRAVGVESEMELAFASLQQLCSPTLDRLERLPGPQQDALGVALALRAGRTPDRFLVALAALSLLSEVAEERPLLCAVDDAQWLDETSALTLAFIARRLLAEPVAIVFVTREPIPALRGLPELILRGVGDNDARLLLASAVVGPLDERVKETIISEARGNPLALLELPRTLTPAELAGGFALAEAQPLTDRIEQSFLQRVQSLPPESQRLLLTAAAEPLGDVALLWRAAERLGVGLDAIGPAEAAALIEVGARVRFPHPLVRSAIYRAATPDDRREIHQALAEATDPDADPDRQAWHRAHAAGGLDESVASDLERSADRAQSRGGVAAMAAFLERAAELTPDPARRGTRALAAAQAKLDAGAPEAAHELLATAELTPLDELQRARLQRLRAQIAFARRRGSDAAPLLLDAAKRLAPLDAKLARETCLEALGASVHAGRFDGEEDVVDIVAAASPESHEKGAVDLLLNGLATRVTAGLPAAAPTLHKALAAFRAAGDKDPEANRWLWLACRVAIDLWDTAAWHELATRAVRRARETGSLGTLPIAITYLAALITHGGGYAEAEILMEESAEISAATGAAPIVHTKQMLAAHRGNEAEALALIKAFRDDAEAKGQAMALSLIDGASTLLFNGLGRYEDACAAGERACAQDDLGVHGPTLYELIEAAARCGRTDLAAATLERLAVRTQASGTDWALGVEARSRALLTDGPAAGHLYEEAVERLSRDRVAFHLARAQLVYGEWLRREKQRIGARDQLRAAYDTFSRIGANAFAERTRHELMATGETARRRTDDTRGSLTSQEAQIAQLARDGLSNPEIGAQLFISPRTVQYHLHKVFAKLDLTSRNQLGRLPASRLRPA